jgi:hypothetical protein
MALRRAPRLGCVDLSRSAEGRAVAPVPEAVTLPTGAEMGIVPLEHRAPDEINNNVG